MCCSMMTFDDKHVSKMVSLDNFRSVLQQTYYNNFFLLFCYCLVARFKTSLIELRFMSSIQHIKITSNGNYNSMKQSVRIGYSKLDEA